jgi:polyhydroxyalkanoate synthase
MVDQQQSFWQAPDSSGVSKAFAEIAERSQLIVNDWLRRNGMTDPHSGGTDPIGVATLFADLTSKMMSIPASMVTAQMSLWQDYFNLWQSTTSRMLGAEMLSSAGGTGRSGEETWHDVDIFGYIKQSFMLTTRWMQAIADAGHDGGRSLRTEMELCAQQFLAALSSAEFTHANPEMLRATIESGGENLITGLQNLLREMEVGLGAQGSPARDPTSFDVGRTVARTPGKVIFRNSLMEVIQYEPQTDRVLRRPLLFVPGWTGKYYVLDLRDRNSLVRWAIELGHTVFMISWVDPRPEDPPRNFEDYVVDGAVTAIEVAQRAAGKDPVNAVGYDLGGTLLAAAMAYLAAGGEGRVGTGSLIASLLDFSQPGELGAIMDEEILCQLNPPTDEPSDVRGLSRTWALQRLNDLLWSFVVNNHLLGNDPFPFDLLHWNCDMPRLPRRLHSAYLDALYRHNKLVEPGGLSVGGRALDLRRITAPIYVMSAREDHIVPWKSAYRAIHLLGSADRFTLAASGHLAGVVNPPTRGRYCYWTNPRTPNSPDEWRAGAKATEGSWWADWDAWIRKRSGDDWVPAREPGGGELEPLCDAPGTYVRRNA